MYIPKKRCGMTKIIQYAKKAWKDADKCNESIASEKNYAGIKRGTQNDRSGDF